MRLLAVGDSIIDGVGTAHVDESLPGQFAIALSEELNRRVHWRIEGQTGYTIEDVLDCLASIEDDHQADILLLSVGVNNVTSVSTTSYWRSKMKQLMDDISRKYPVCQRCNKISLFLMKGEEYTDMVIFPSNL